jgi:hypothetical protein
MSNDLHRSIPAVIGGKNGALSININVPMLTPRYIDELWRSACLPDLLRSGWYPDVKELTESCAAFRASAKLHLDWGNPGVCVIAVGDGRWPRTAGMFAYRSKWTAIAVDPRAAIEGAVPGVQRCYSRPVCLAAALTPWSDFELPAFTDYVYVCVHSHAPAAEVLASVARAPGTVHIVSNRCCVDDSLALAPDYEYLDWGIWSPERRVRIWRDVLSKMRAIESTPMSEEPKS